MAPLSHHRLEPSLPVDEPLYEYSSILCGKHLMRGSDFEGVRKQMSPLSFKKNMMSLGIKASILSLYGVCGHNLIHCEDIF